MILISFVVQYSDELAQVEHLHTLRGVIEATYSKGIYSQSAVLFKAGELDAALTFETLQNDTPGNRAQALAVATAIRAAIATSRFVGVFITPGVEYTRV